MAVRTPETYSKTEWTYGKLITQQLMNKVEEQLETLTPPALGAVRFEKDQSNDLSDDEKLVAQKNINGSVKKFKDFHLGFFLDSAGNVYFNCDPD